MSRKRFGRRSAAGDVAKKRRPVGAGLVFGIKGLMVF